LDPPIKDHVCYRGENGTCALQTNSQTERRTVDLDDQGSGNGSGLAALDLGLVLLFTVMGLFTGLRVMPLPSGPITKVARDASCPGEATASTAQFKVTKRPFWVYGALGN